MQHRQHGPPPPAAWSGRTLRLLTPVLLLLLLLLLSLARPSAAQSTVRTVIPDLVGGLYPMAATGRVMSFGASPNAAWFTAPASFVSSSGDLGVNCTPTALCLELVLSSTYAADPFVLVSFASSTQIRSVTFDGLSAPATVRPLIAGTAPSTNDSSSNSNNVDDGDATLWRFHVPKATTLGPSLPQGTDTSPHLDVLLRLRQQSQLASRRDQVLVHIATTQSDPSTTSTAVESFVVYGNARVQHETSAPSANQVRVDVRITRDATEPDVVTDDGYPLVRTDLTVPPGTPTTRWQQRDPQCLHASAVLYGCASDAALAAGSCTYESSTAALPQCLRTTFGWSISTFATMLAANSIGSGMGMASSIQACFATVLQQEADADLSRLERRWWNATLALATLATRSCPFGPLDGVLPSDPPTAATKMFRLSANTMYAHTLRLSGAMATFSGAFLLRFGAAASLQPDGGGWSLMTSTFSETTTGDAIAAMIWSRLAELGVSEVTASVTGGSEGGGEDWTIQVGIRNLLFPDFALSYQPQAGAGVISDLGEVVSFAELQTVAIDWTKLRAVDRCDACAAEVGSCGADATCRTQVLPCVISAVQGLATTATPTYDARYATYHVDLLGPVLACIGSVPTSSWDGIRRAIVCVAAEHCPMGATTVLNPAEQTLLRLSDATQVFAVPFVNDGSANQRVTLSVSGRQVGAPQDLVFDAPVADLAAFVEAFVLGNAADVVITTSPYGADPALVQVTVTTHGLLGLGPVFSGSGLVPIQDTPVTAFLEYAETSAFSAEGLLRVLAMAAMATPVADVVLPHSWLLAPECATCSMMLYGACNGSAPCEYGRAATPLGVCLRQLLPTSLLSSILTDASSGSSNEGSGVVTAFGTGRVVATELSQCTAKALTALGDNPQSRRLLASTMGCFQAQSCPFGPLGLVDQTRMLQLQASTMTQLLRIRTQSFALRLVFSLGPVVLGDVIITDSTSRAGAMSSLNMRLGDIGIVAAVPIFALEPGGGEWSLVIMYANAVAPDFAVTVAQDSVPVSGLMDLTVLRPTPRVVVTPRQFAKVYLAPEPTPETQPPSPVPTPAPSSPTWTWLSSTCTRCDMQHLTACARSRFCRTVVVPCLLDAVQSTLAPAGAPAQDFDLAPVVRSCASASTAAGVAGGGWNESYFDWWAPIQRWLGCYAAARCPIAITSTEGSPMAMARLSWESLKLELELTNVGETVSLPIRAPAGASMATSATYDFSGTVGELAELLEDLTQGVARGPVIDITEGSTPSTKRLKIDFGPEFLGEAPTVVTGVDVTLLASTPARVRIETQSGVSDPSVSLWDGILSGLQQVASIASSLTPPVSTGCGGCSQQFLGACRADVDCGGYLLECVATSLGEQTERLHGRDRNLTQVFVGCADHGIVHDALQRFVLCSIDNQCSVSDSMTTPATYLRLRPTRETFQLPLNQSGIVLDYRDSVFSTQSTTQLFEDMGLIAPALTQLIVPSGSVSLTLSPLPGDPSVMVVDIDFAGIVGSAPVLAAHTTTKHRSAPALVAYSTNEDAGAISTSDMATLLASFMTVPDCGTVCDVHLAACTTGNTVEALQCRESILPCVQNVFSSAGGFGGTSTSIDLSLPLRNCGSGFAFMAMYPLARYFRCVARSGCSVSAPSYLNSRTSLRVVDGQDTLIIGDSVTTVSAFPPVGSIAPDPNVAQQFSGTINAPALEYLITQKLLNGAVDVAINAIPMPDEAATKYVIAYQNYLSELPSFSSPVTSLGPQLGSVGLAFLDTTRKSWSRLQAALQRQVDALSRNCNSCSTQYLFACGDCASVILPCMVAQLTQLSPWLGSTSFSQSVRQCVQTMALDRWVPFEKYLQCYMRNGCPVGLGEGSSHASYMLVAEPYVDITVPDVVSQEIEVFPPIGSLSESLRTPGDQVMVNRVSGFSELKDAFRSMFLAAGAGTEAAVAVRELPREPGSNQFTLRVQAINYYGEMPATTTSNVHWLTLSFATISASAMTGWDLFLANIQLFTVPPPPPPPTWVLANACATCGTVLFGCAAAEIADNTCGYLATTNSFATCLMSRVNYEVYQALVPTLGASQLVTSDIEYCMTQVQAADETANAASFVDDGWYKATEGLSCFEANHCAFGPLGVATTTEAMVRLESGVMTKSFRIMTESFAAATFRVTYGFRVLTSASFESTTADAGIVTVLKSILPQSTEVQVSMALTNTADAYDITLTYHYLYFPATVTVLVDGVTVVDQTPDAAWSAQIKTIAFDSSNLVDIQPRR